jgi:hypothetical protein
VLDACFAPSHERSAAETILDCLVVGQKTQGGADERVVLFVKLPEGHQGVPNELEKSIRAEIRTRRSPRHVPARVSRDINVQLCTASAISIHSYTTAAHARCAIDHPGGGCAVHTERKASRGAREEGWFISSSIKRLCIKH